MYQLIGYLMKHIYFLKISTVKFSFASIPDLKGSTLPLLK